MPKEIELVEINGEDLEANLTDLFGTSSEDFLSFLSTHFSVTGDRKKKTI